MSEQFKTKLQRTTGEGTVQNKNGIIVMKPSYHNCTLPSVYTNGKRTFPNKMFVHLSDRIIEVIPYDIQ